MKLKVKVDCVATAGKWGGPRTLQLKAGDIVSGIRMGKDKKIMWIRKGLFFGWVAIENVEINRPAPPPETPSTTFD